MKDHEIVAKFLNRCVGAAQPQSFFEEAEPESADDFVRTKHGKDFDKFEKEVLPHSQFVCTYDNATVTYLYEFAEQRVRCKIYVLQQTLPCLQGIEVAAPYIIQFPGVCLPPGTLPAWAGLTGARRPHISP